MSRRPLVGFKPDRLKDARVNRGWSLGELALQATRAQQRDAAERGEGVPGTNVVSPTAISAWERGDNFPQVDKLKWVALALQVPMDHLIDVPREERTLGTWRALAGRTTPDMAAAMDISTGLLTGLELGHNRLMDDVAGRLAEELGLSVEEVRAAYERGRQR